MLNGKRPTRLLPIVAALLLLGSNAGCGEEHTTAPITGVAAQAGAIRLTVGTQTVTVFENGKVTLGPLSFVRPNAQLTAALLDKSGNLLTVSGDEVQVKMGVQTGGSTITFTRTGPFSGTLAATGTAPASRGFGVSLYDNATRRTVFGPYYVGIVVR